jgi:argininosuccinate lyase
LLPRSPHARNRTYITDGVFSVLSVDKSVKSRLSDGGTAPKNVRAQARK